MSPAQTTREIVDFVTALLKFTCFSLSTTVETQCTPQRSPWWLYLITVNTTSLDQHKLYYCNIALMRRVAKVKTVSSAHSMADVIPFLSKFNIPFKSNASIKPKENIFAHHNSKKSNICNILSNNFFMNDKKSKRESRYWVAVSLKAVHCISGRKKVFPQTFLSELSWVISKSKDLRGCPCKNG